MKKSLPQESWKLKTVVKKMSKLIAIWGPPGAGKTTFTIKLGAALHDKHRKSVYTVFADNTIPALPVVFPTKKADELLSVGTALSKVDTTQRDVEACTVTVKNFQNIGYLGYKDGENRFSYPQPHELKCLEFLAVLKDMADFVLVDCTSVPDTLSKMAMSKADVIIRLVSPELKSVCFCASQLPIMEDPMFQIDKHLVVLNVNTTEVFLPVADAEHYFGKNIATLPYNPEIRQQSANGELVSSTMHKKYNVQLNAIMSKILE